MQLQQVDLMSNDKIICKKEGRKLLSFFFIINTLYYIYKVMIKKYEEFLNDDIQLNESEEKMVNEAAEKIAKIINSSRSNALEKIKNGETVDEGLFGSVVGGLTGAAIGPAIGRAICKALGITGGLLYNLLNSRMFTSAVAAYIGYKN